jgi:hypothetical protein
MTLPRNLSVLLACGHAINGLLSLTQIVNDDDDADECHWMSFTVVDIMLSEIAGDMNGLDAFLQHTKTTSHAMCCAYLYTKLLRARGDRWSDVMSNPTLSKMISNGQFEDVMGLLMVMEEEAHVEDFDTSEILITLKRLSLNQKICSEVHTSIDRLIAVIDPVNTNLRTLN